MHFYIVTIIKITFDIFRSHENLGKVQSRIVTKEILPYSSLKSMVLSGKPDPFKICISKPVLCKNLARCVLPGAPIIKFKKRSYPTSPMFQIEYLCLKLQWFNFVHT